MKTFANSNISFNKKDLKLKILKLKEGQNLIISLKALGVEQFNYCRSISVEMLSS